MQARTIDFGARGLVLFGLARRQTAPCSLASNPRGTVYVHHESSAAARDVDPWTPVVFVPGGAHRDIRSRLTGTCRLRGCADDAKKASAKVRRCFRRLHAHGPIRTRILFFCGKLDLAPANAGSH